MDSDLQGEDNDLALFGPLHAWVAVGLKAGERRERDLLLPRVLPHTNPKHPTRLAPHHAPQAGQAGWEQAAGDT